MYADTPASRRQSGTSHSVMWIQRREFLPRVWFGRGKENSNFAVKEAGISTSVRYSRSTSTGDTVYPGCDVMKWDFASVIFLPKTKNPSLTTRKKKYQRNPN